MLQSFFFFPEHVIELNNYNYELFVMITLYP